MRRGVNTATNPMAARPNCHCGCARELSTSVTLSVGSVRSDSEATASPATNAANAADTASSRVPGFVTKDRHVLCSRSPRSAPCSPPAAETPASAAASPPGGPSSGAGFNVAGRPWQPPVACHSRRLGNARRTSISARKTPTRRYVAMMPISQKRTPKAMATPRDKATRRLVAPDVVKVPPA